MTRSEHNLSRENSPDRTLPERNRSVFSRGAFRDLNGRRAGARSGWSKFTSGLSSWFSFTVHSVKSVDWKANGRLLLPTLGRALQLTGVLAFLIAILIRLKYANKPRGDLPQSATFSFRYNVSGNPDTVPWDPDFGPYNVLLETHSHSYFSDGAMSPEQVVEWAIAYGYTAVVVSDHNTIEGGLGAKKYVDDMGYANHTIVAIPAVEYTCCRVHMNLIGINETIAPSNAWPSDDEIQAAINRTHELGGIAVLNHWAWSHVTEGGYDQWRIPGHPTRERLLSWGVDAFESVNGFTIDLATLRFSTEHDLPVYAGGDIHGPTHEPHAWTTLLVDEDDKFNQTAILARFKKPGATSFLFNAEGPIERSLVPRNPAWDKWAPLTSIDFGYLYDEQSGMYSFTGEFCHERRFAVRKWRAVWFVIWIVLAFFIYEVTRALVLWGWGWFIKRREGRIRLPLME